MEVSHLNTSSLLFFSFFFSFELKGNVKVQKYASKMTGRRILLLDIAYRRLSSLISLAVLFLFNRSQHKPFAGRHKSNVAQCIIDVTRADQQSTGFIRVSSKRIMQVS